MAQEYLFVKQGRLSRWQYSSPNDKAFGLYTEGFFNCVIIILRAKDKVVSFHADKQITLDDIRKEIAWCGKECEKYVYYKEHKSAEETIDDIFGVDPLKKEFTFKLIKAIRKNGKIVDDTDSPLLNGTFIPEFEAAAIHVDFKGNTLSKGYLIAKEGYIKNDGQIQDRYNKFQKKKWDTNGNIKGSKTDYYEKKLMESGMIGDNSAAAGGLEAQLAQARLNAMAQLRKNSEKKEKSSSSSTPILTAYKGSIEQGLSTALQRLEISKDHGSSSTNTALQGSAVQSVIEDAQPLSTTDPIIGAKDQSSASKNKAFN